MKRYILGTVVTLIALFLFVVIVLAAPAFSLDKQEYGVSFSAPHAAGIGLDWRKTYRAVIEDLGVKRIRLSAYWNVMELSPDEYVFEDLDYQFKVAQENNVKIILSIGRKLPRWPECHTPEWANNLSEAEQQEKVLVMLRKVIQRYQSNTALYMWQLENEPLLDFGHCPAEDLKFLAKEEALLRLLDNHPILITDSGELNSWIPAAKFGDVLGTTMYRTVYSGRTKKVFSYDYILPAWFYRLKGRLVKVLRGKDVLISELQGEPWGEKPFTEMSREQRQTSLSVQRLKQIQSFASRTQFSEAYWWGVEYWYWEKEKNNDDSFWNTAKSFFNN